MMLTRNLHESACNVTEGTALGFGMCTLQSTDPDVSVKDDKNHNPIFSIIGGNIAGAFIVQPSKSNPYDMEIYAANS